MDLERALKLIRDDDWPNNELRIRHIYDFDLKDEELSVILETLKQQPNKISKIFLECNLSSVGLQKIAKFLEDNPQIESFDCWNRPSSLDKQKDNLAYFVPVIQKNKGLKRLTLSGIGVEHANTAQFFAALKSNTSLESLLLYSSSFRKIEVAQQIADMIANNTALKSLRLNGHVFEKEALGVIANALPSNKTLEELDISSGFYNLGDEGAILFANQLAKDIHLKSIRFFESNITATGAKALAASLASNTHLSKLDLGCNSIGKEGTLALAEALKTNQTLQSLKVGVYSANGEGVKAFADMLEKNTSLRKFDYNAFYTSGDGMDKLRIDMGLTRNQIAFLKNGQKTEATDQKLQKATQKLNNLQVEYEQQISPPNFSDYVKFRIKAMRGGRGGCCAFSFWGENKFSIGSLDDPSTKKEESSESKMSPTLKR